MAALAAFDYEEAIKRDPGNMDYRVDRIDALLQDKKKDEARRELDSLVKMGMPKATLLDFYKRCK